MLERLEHRVDIVENGILAVDAVIDGWYRERPYDLILMDTYMPFMNGFHAMAEIRRFEEEQGFTRTPIVVLTAEEG
ncbi:histidine kinase osmosensor [Tulasnella sp. 417]|nr:histidine kinase osmosensor [Tulasnella sp. 417]